MFIVRRLSVAREGTSGASLSRKKGGSGLRLCDDQPKSCHLIPLQPVEMAAPVASPLSALEQAMGITAEHDAMETDGCGIPDEDPDATPPGRAAVSYSGGDPLFSPGMAADAPNALHHHT